ncbi:replication-associated recombination protein A [Nitrosomonas communis]|uniref:replication-associated recombination protein A n=1 Tax=Nitrosomonas communis TaxID=44574 RepID=UPI0026F13C37|nr:replication-associated recombination protein A [Nitrosomonas communis]MCO6427896.1 replication-associated recombination protein A [Nitrosomonas communis]
MTDLFAPQKPAAPLAERLRPQSLDEIIGQAHLLGAGKPLRLAFESGKPHSMILWGPPGSGKTTLARLMARVFEAEFIALSAVLSGVKDIRDAIERAQRVLQQSGRHTILFVDEVHRFNKAQQDAFLPYVEQGLITFIGATTENPSFEVNRALLSRSQVYALSPLSEEELKLLFERACQSGLPKLHFSEEARNLLTTFADGDARRLLNLLEQANIAAETEGVREIDVDYLRNILSRSMCQFDKGGDEFYDQISALHKSIRGSSPDAALYWMCRMLDGGTDPLYIGRRLIRAATEDIGLADPRALTITLDACHAYERLGSPEGELALAQAALYLACAPKSNAAYLAYKKARALVEHDQSRRVPIHLRNAPTKLMKDMDFGKNYRYAHDEPEAYAAGENYFPDDMPPTDFYQPTAYGLEAKIAEKLTHLRQLDAQAKKHNQKK